MTDPKREELERAALIALENYRLAVQGVRYNADYEHRAMVDAASALRDHLTRPVWAPCQAAGRPAIENRRTAEAIMFSDGDPALRDRVLRLLNESEKK